MGGVEEARADLQRRIDGGEFPGIQVLVLNRAGPLFEFNGGLRDPAQGLPVTAETTFMGASSTKVVTALAILQLVEQGLVALDDPLSAHVQDHPYGGELTLRQLIVHTGGVPNPLPLDWLHPVADHEGFDEGATRQGVLAAHPKLKSAPGKVYRYSNLGYWLLSMVIEQAAGLSYADYLRQRILDPLGISPRDLGCRIPDPAQHAVGTCKRFSMLHLMLRFMAPGFVLGDPAGRWRCFRPVYMNGSAYGGLIGTAKGWGVLLQDQLADTSKIIKPETKQRFYEAQRAADGRASGMTLGWHTGQLAGVVYHSKPGGGPGFASNIRVYPERGIASAWFRNSMEISETPNQRLSDAIDVHFLR